MTCRGCTQCLLWEGSYSMTTPCFRAISITHSLWVWLQCPSKFIRNFSFGLGFTTEMKWRFHSQNTSVNPDFVLTKEKSARGCSTWEVLLHPLPGIKQHRRDKQTTGTYCIHASYIVPLFARRDGLICAFLFHDFPRAKQDCVRARFYPLQIFNPQFILNRQYSPTHKELYATRLCWTQKL
jgi:hypothetical protein